ncbi:MAG: XRE family transcriptional regulator [Opitutus sp.]|nr:XRE family transcriptional regulator [Opitutus sp.]
MPRPKNIVGPQVRRCRDKLGWSQGVLAAKCQIAGWDISRSIVAAIEGRVRWVGDFEFVMLAKVLRVPPTELLPKQIDWSELAPRKR